METKDQRRTRLIEAYSGKHILPKWGELNPCAKQVVFWAEQLADEVIAKTPQPTSDPRGDILLAEKFIDDLFDLCQRAKNLLTGSDERKDLSREQLVSDWLEDLCTTHEHFRALYINGEK